MRRSAPMPEIEGMTSRDVSAAQRRLYGAALGYQPMRMKPVHFATSFILALTGRAYRLELLNKASVPRATPKAGSRVVDEYVAENLLPVLVEAGRLAPSVDEASFRILRSHLNAAFNNDGGALGPGFAPHKTFGVDYSAPTVRYVCGMSKNHGLSGTFVARVLGATEVGRRLLDACRAVLELPPPPLEALGRPLLDEEPKDWVDTYDEQFGNPDPAMVVAHAEAMAPRTEALGRLLATLLRERSVYAVRYMVIGLCLWLFSYLMLRRGGDPILLVDALEGRNARIRTQSRATYARELDRFAHSFDAWRAGEGAGIDPAEWEVFAGSSEARKVIEDHFRDLGVRIGVVQPRAPTARRKHIELQADTLRVLAMTLLREDEVVSVVEFADRLRSVWRICSGSAPGDLDLLRSLGFGPLDADEDLEPNARAFHDLLVRLGLAVSPSDGLTLCALRAGEVI